MANIKIGDVVRVVRGPNPLLPSDMEGVEGTVAYVDQRDERDVLYRVDIESERDMDWYFWPEEVVKVSR